MMSVATTTPSHRGRRRATPSCARRPAPTSAKPWESAERFWPRPMRKVIDAALRTPWAGSEDVLPAGGGDRRRARPDGELAKDVGEMAAHGPLTNAEDLSHL